MSDTLTWHHALGTKTGTTAALLFTNLATLINSKSADANFSWQIAIHTTTTSPYMVLKRKSGAPGRILLWVYNTAPVGFNPTLFDQDPFAQCLYGAYFPNSVQDTAPTNLTTTTGAVLGDDTGAVKAWAAMDMPYIYTTGVRVFIFDSADAMVFGFQNPTSNVCIVAAAGNIIVDALDNAHPAVLSTATVDMSQVNAGGVLAWTSTQSYAGDGAQCVRTNYGKTNNAYFLAWLPTGSWANQAIGSVTSVLVDPAVGKAFFAPFQLLSQTKGEGFVVKLRQFAIGPPASGAFSVYNTNGPVVAARQLSAFTGGASNALWMTNFKL